MLYLYCLASPASGAPSHSLVGIESTVVCVVEASSLHAWVSKLTQAPAPTGDNARAHDRVIRDAMRLETPLPARFGQAFESEGTLRASISIHEGVLTAALERVRGAVEMTVRALLAPRSTRPPDTVSTGKGYMAQLQERQKAEEETAQEANFLQRRISNVIAPFVLAEARGKNVPRSRSVYLSHLVAAAVVESYRAELRLLCGADSSLELLVSGPWAPYSFAGIPDA